MTLTEYVEMVDEPEIYESHGRYCVDCMFGGYFCLCWEE